MGVKGKSDPMCLRILPSLRVADARIEARICFRSPLNLEPFDYAAVPSLIQFSHQLYHCCIPHSFLHNLNSIRGHLHLIRSFIAFCGFHARLDHREETL